jgi:Ca-activated chloride channel family protein
MGGNRKYKILSIRFRAQSKAALFVLFAVVLGAQSKPDIQVNVDLVTVACAVNNHSGAPAENLTSGVFKLLDNGEPRVIRNFWRESDLPLTVALVADISGSQSAYIRSHRQAIEQFLSQVIGPRDRAMVVEVAQQSLLLAPLTASKDELRSAVANIGMPAGKQAPALGPPCRSNSFPHSCGGTALWHGLYYTALALQPVAGRKAIIILSDGLDTGSDIALPALVEAAQSAGTVVYAMKYLSPMRFFSISGAIAQAVSHGLERLCRETGGLVFPSPGKHTAEVFARIEADLRNLYVLGFTPPAGERDGKFHTLQVTTTRPDLVIRARAGYWASRN